MSRQYRTLAEGEITQRDDQTKHRSSAVWCKLRNHYGHPVETHGGKFEFRRLVSVPTEKEEDGVS